ncbi:MAG TPA: MmcQ/YjbR family DNA-binding protein [Pyrinomonadaceae bacterium]|nr:MmcQ/YjbR family DNA-binding protein [Pyrinomonadaceae bacterium]
MDSESVRAHCLSFPQATENVQWGNDLVFKIAGKMFAVMALEGPVKYITSFKCTEEKYNELIEQEGMDPAPYMARNKWVAIERFDVLSDKELKELLRNSYDLVCEKLPRKVREQIGAASPPAPRPRTSAAKKRR